MKTTPYTYHGPDSGISIPSDAPAKEGEPTPAPVDVMLRNGRTVHLPASSQAVATLLAQGFLKPVPTVIAPTGETGGEAPPPAPAPVKSAKAK